MKKKELIEYAINNPVEIEEIDGTLRFGWLVKDNDKKNCYDLLPFNSYKDVWCYRISHIKHIWHLNNGHKIW